MSIKSKTNSLIFSITSLVFISLPNITLAQNNLSGQMKSILDKTAGIKGAGFDTQNNAGNQLPLVIGGIIRIILSFLGIIFFIFVVYGGFLWMTAGGSKEQVTKSQDLVKNAAIGLVIVMIAYTIVHFIMMAIINAGSIYGSNLPL